MKSGVIVSGLPRSGTSMMMRMLEAGGMPVLTDNLRIADEDNPNGYFEFENCKKLKHDSAWLVFAEGKAVKMVSMLLYDLPPDKDYRVIFMKRDLDEVVASQKVMLQRLGEESAARDFEMKELYGRHLLEIERWLCDSKNIGVQYVDYREVLESPRTIALSISRFLGRDLNIEDMVGVVDKSLYRQRSEQTAKANTEGEGCDAPPAIEESDEAKIRSQLSSLGYL